MLSEEAVEACLAEGRDALVLLSELLASGSGSSSEVCVRARAELDALICLLDESPTARRADVEYVIERYEALVRSTSN